VVSVANIGGTASGDSNIKLHLGSNTGPVIATIDLPPLVRFASVDLAYEWHVPAPTQSLYTLVAIADEGAAIVESNKLNNSYQVTLMGDSVVIGDINGDQLVDLADAILCLQLLSGMLPGNINPAEDVNGDGKIGMAEAIYAMQKSAGL
jgi:hypothetical protein